MKKRVITAMVGLVGCLGLGLGLGSTSAMAATTFWQQSLPVNHDARLKIGANVSANRYAYDQKNDTTVMPQAFYDNNRVYIEGAEAGIYGCKDATNEWRLTVGYDSREFRAEDANSTALRQLNDRDPSVLVGTSYMRITPYGGFKGQIETDVLGKSDGTTAKLAHLSRFKVANDKITLYPEIGLQWYDDKYNGYYYGVDAAESARSGIAAYTPDSSVNLYGNVSAVYDFNSRLSGFISQHLEMMSIEQRDSPLVDGRFDSKTKIGLNYQF